MVVEDGVADKVGIRGGEEVAVNKAAEAEGAEAGACGEKGRVCGGRKRSGSGGGGD